MTSWTAPRTWAYNDDVDEDMLNEQIRDNMLWLYLNLPTRATMWHENSIVTAGGGSITRSVNASQPYNHYCLISTTANGDVFTQSCVLAAGTYTLYILCVTEGGSGKVDFTLDGSAIGTVDFYQAGTNYNQVKTVASVVVSTGGRHVLAGTTNGKNVSSGGYRAYVTKFWFKAVSDATV